MQQEHWRGLEARRGCDGIVRYCEARELGLSTASSCQCLSVFLLVRARGVVAAKIERKDEGSEDGSSTSMWSKKRQVPGA